MTAKRNANIVSLTKQEKAAAVRGLTNQVSLLRDESRSDSPGVNAAVEIEIATMTRVIEKLSS